MVLILGITGGLATGKSSVAQMFGNLGAKVVSADKIARELLKPRSLYFERVVKEFGQEILKNGEIDRKKLADIVFKDRSKLKRLERIVHPQVKKMIRKEIQAYKKFTKKGVIVLDVPLLFEAGLEKFVQYTIVVKASRKEQLKRAQKLSLDRNKALERIRAQWPLGAKLRLADIVINNEGSKKQTEKKVKRIWQKLTLNQDKHFVSGSG